MIISLLSLLLISVPSAQSMEIQDFKSKKQILAHAAICQTPIACLIYYPKSSCTYPAQFNASFTSLHTQYKDKILFVRIALTFIQAKQQSHACYFFYNEGKEVLEQLLVTEYFRSHGIKALQHRLNNLLSLSTPEVADSIASPLSNSSIPEQLDEGYSTPRGSSPIFGTIIEDYYVDLPITPESPEPEFDIPDPEFEKL